MSLHVIPTAKARHPSAGARPFRGALDTADRTTYLEDACLYGVEDDPVDEARTIRSIARQHLFRLGFGEIPSPRRIASHAPIVARRRNEVVGLVLEMPGIDPQQGFDIVNLELARDAAEREAGEGDVVSAGIIRIRIVAGDRRIVEISAVGSPSLTAMPVAPFS